jgi:hypothetical protein
MNDDASSDLGVLQQCGLGVFVFGATSKCVMYLVEKARNKKGKNGILPCYAATKNKSWLIDRTD